MKKTFAFFKRHKAFTVYLVLVLLIVLVALFAKQIAPYDPTASKLRNAFQPPSPEHRFGTDFLGRDLFSRVVFGTRVSISSALILVAAAMLLGGLLGIVAGFAGGGVDAFIMRLCDTMLAFPDLILAIAIAGILGPSFVNAIIAILAVSWTKYARLARSTVLKIKQRDYIAAAHTTGSKGSHILSAYLIPNALPTLLTTAMLDIGTTMLSVSSLSFLGFGIQPPTPEWGYMLSEGRSYIQTAPWLMVYPGLSILITVVAFNLLGDSIRDILDPGTRRSHKKKKKTKSHNINAGKEPQ
jgi:peptide/nickel transport system permease protein/nickel transport system permease protein